MHKSVYDVLHVRYRLHRRLKKPQEQLAQAIVASGRMRLDADNESNFVRLLLPAERVNMTFSLREISDVRLYAKSYERLLAEFSKRHDGQKAQLLTRQYLEKVKEDFKKRHPVNPKTEVMMARALVCCNAYPVIYLLHLEGAEIYISFGHSVGDVMDIARWGEVGSNSGLQAVGAGENAVYVSCGGHPFLSPPEYRHSGEGPPALARFMIIAAQETGHNGDMIRGADGKWIGRHSAIAWGREASPKARLGRLADVKRMEALWQQCQRFGVRRIAKWENSLKFYRGVKVFSWRRLLVWCGSKIGWQVFKLLLRSQRMTPLCRLQRDAYPANLLLTYFPDMFFNLDPQADVYRRKDPKEEEAITCIEALARIPQQVVKWGHPAVNFCTPHLYKLYYSELVPACSKAVQRLLAVKM